MPKVEIDGRTVEVPEGTNLIEAGLKVGVQIPHYCYHPRLSVVGQCRMCLVALEGAPKLVAACSTQVMKDGMVVHTETEEVSEAQRAMMEFLLINHPLDCPICDQAGECGLQDYAFKHGVAYSRFRFEDKRTYPQKERIPLGPNVLLNMNRCIQCTRCIRFTEEITETAELGFFQRGARTEIGVFPGKPLDNDLATCVVDICPVGALTSTRFRFAERVWYLDKKPSICTGCDVGCNITLEHRRGEIRRYKPRFNPEVNDYWMCDYGRSTHERYDRLPRLLSPLLRKDEGEIEPVSWRQALDTTARHLRMRSSDRTIAVLGSGDLTTEEAYLLGKIADRVGTPHRGVISEPGEKVRTIPNTRGGISGAESSPNRRGAELAGLARIASTAGRVLEAVDLLEGDGAAHCATLIVAGAELAAASHDVEVMSRLRQAHFLVVLGWADTPLARMADVVLPISHHGEKDGTFVNCEGRLQAFFAAFPPPGQVRSGTAVLGDLLSRLDGGRPEKAWTARSPAEVFDCMAAELPCFAGLTWETLPPEGLSLKAERDEPTEEIEIGDDPAGAGDEDTKNVEDGPGDLQDGEVGAG